MFFNKYLLSCKTEQTEAGFIAVPVVIKILKRSQAVSIEPALIKRLRAVQLLEPTPVYKKHINNT